MVKHRKLDSDIYRRFTKIADLVIVYLVRKKLVIFEQVKILRVWQDFSTLCFISLSRNFFATGCCYFFIQKSSENLQNFSINTFNTDTNILFLNPWKFWLSHVLRGQKWLIEWNVLKKTSVWSPFES